MAKLTTLILATFIALLPVISNADEITVNQQKNQTWVDGDIVLTEDQMRDRDRNKNVIRPNEFNTLGPQQLVLNYAQYNWQNGEVPYALSGTASGDQKTVDAINGAIRDYEQNTCIRFKTRTTETDYVEFIKGDGCWSYIGRVGGRQEISIGSGCETAGIVAHEIFHALGRWHEQSRPDRDLYVTIHDANIRDGTESNFEIVETNSVITTQSIPYDIGSVMHYSAYSFSTNGQPTITPKNSSIPLNSLGQRDGLAISDIQHVQKLYCGGVSGTWSQWSGWSDCTMTCNGGTQTRSRTCMGGTGCNGTNIETRNCNTQSCPVPASWSAWGTWSGCTATCGTGQRSRTRTCQNGNTCSGASKQYENCNTQSCPSPAVWSEWGTWSDCSATCEPGGVRSRHRHCVNGTTCQGETTQVVNCNTGVSCTKTTEWSEWSACTVSCGGGTRTRSRGCGSDSQCQIENEECNKDPCPTTVRGMIHKGCYSLPYYARTLKLLERSTPDLSDNPLLRTNAVEKCGDAAYKFNYEMFSLVIGFCISGSNSSSDFITSVGVSCKDGKGGFYYDPLYQTYYYYMDVYQIVEQQQFSDSISEILYSSTIIRATPTATPTSNVFPPGNSAGYYSISSIILFSITLLLSTVFVVLL